MATTDSLKIERDQLVAEADGILARSDDTLDGQDRARYDQVLARLREVNDQLEMRRARLEAMTGGSGVVVETGDGARGAGEFRDSVSGVNVNRGAGQGSLLERAGHAGGINTSEGGQLVRDAARAAIEQWSSRSDTPPEHQESAERAVSGSDRDSRQVAELVATISTPEYERAFRAWMVGGPTNLMSDDVAEIRRVNSYLASRAMNEGSGAAGQFAVPSVLDPALILTDSGSTNPFRTISTTKVIATQTWAGVTTAGSVCHWSAEASEYTDDSPTVGSASITPVRMSSLIQMSWELAEDSNLASDVARLFSEGRANLEAAAFATGSGSTQPYGIVTELGLVTASRVDANTNGTFGAVDLFALDTQVPSRWRASSSWVGNQAWWNRARQLGTQLGYSFWTDMSPGTPPVLLGHPVFESSAMQSTLSAATASSDDCIILGDFRAGYYIVDRTPSTIVSTDWIVGANRRPTGERAWALYSRVGARCVAPQAFRMLRL